jgi:hypothetical protein
MPRICSADNCSNPVLGGSKCKYHQYQRRMLGGDMYNKPLKSPPSKHLKTLSTKRGTIHRRTSKRALDERYYAEKAKKFFEEAVKNKINDCFFCGMKVFIFQGLHHLLKRDGSKLNDFTKTVIVHNDCHLFFHSATLEQLESKPWFNQWMGRLKSVSLEAYNKEMRKTEKNINLFEQNEE